MKQLLLALTMMFAGTLYASEPVKAVQNDKPNCVTKDKKGNCPPPPKSEKPTPKKKKSEAK